ncbi:MAG: hypothetical protein ACK50E_07530, partial [Bacteroidota bacterium]
MMLRQTSLTALLFLLLFPAFAQRNNTGTSVLQNGVWAKLAVKNAGVYRVDLPLLQSLGFNQNTFPSASIRLFGNVSGMLPENNAIPRTDDLSENAILVFDGGDGVFNGADYFLFYSEGPDRWLKDSLNQRFRHQKNLYSAEAFYFITIGGAGLRIQQRDPTASGNKTVTSFRDRVFYELDSVNMLKSGKQWYGEEFGNLPGRPLSRQFTLNIPALISGETAFLQSEVIGRTAGASSTMRISVGSSTVLTHLLPSVGTGQYDQIASTSNTGNTFIPNSSNSISLTYTFQPGGINSQAWLNWFEVFPKRNLSLAGVNQLLFRDWESVGLGNIAEFRLTEASVNTAVWDVTVPENPVALKPVIQGNELRFSASAERLREYVAF